MALVGEHSFSWPAPSVPFLLPGLASVSCGDSCEQSRCAPGIMKLVTAGGNTTGDCQAQPRASSRGWPLQSPRRASTKTTPKACQGLLLSREECWELWSCAAKSLSPASRNGLLIFFKAFGGFPLPKLLENGLMSTFQIDAFHAYPSSGKTDNNSPAFCLSECDAPTSVQSFLLAPEQFWLQLLRYLLCRLHQSKCSVYI